MAVTLRPYREADVTTMHAAALESCEQLEPWMPWCHRNYGIDEAKQWVALTETGFREKTQFEFVVLDERGDFAGGCGLNQFDLLNKRANLGYWMRTSATRRGRATEAVRLAVQWAAANTDFERIEVLVAMENEASLRVAAKAGAIREGVLRSRLLLHGRFHDAVMHAFIRGVNLSV